jgi:spermidine synthase
VVPWEILGRERAPGGGELVLARRGTEYSIRVDGRELMSSRLHTSEEELARLACSYIRGEERPRVLVGGLGLGYTLRAALDALPAEASATVAEIVPAVIAWNQGPLAPLAGHPLADPRVDVDPRDVAIVLAAGEARFDAILLDVDNGPESLTRAANADLYGARGLARARRALRPGGVLAVWSAARHSGFADRLVHAGFVVERREVPPRPGAGGRKHTIFLGRV